MNSQQWEDLIFKNLRYFAQLKKWPHADSELREGARFLLHGLVQRNVGLFHEAPEDIMTRAQCARYLKVSLPTLDRLVHEQNLPCLLKNTLVKERKHRLFLRREVLEWMAEKPPFELRKGA